MLHNENGFEVLQSPRQAHGKLTLSTFEGALFLVQQSIGAGFAGLPFAFYSLGIPLSSALLLLIAIATWISSKLYLEVRTLVPGNLHTINELGYILFGKSSIYYVGCNITMLGIGLCIMYFIIFGDVCSSLVNSLCGDAAPGILKHRATFDILLGALAAREVLKKEVKELKIAFYSLFIGIGLFIVLLGGEFLIVGKPKHNIDTDENYMKIHMSIGSITGISALLTAFNMQQGIYPMFNSMKEKTNENAMLAVRQCLIFCVTMYVLISTVGVYYFGSNIKASVLDNIGLQDNWESLVLRFMFLFILAAHLVGTFYPCKESFLVMVDEYNRHSIERHLHSKQNSRIQNVLDEPSTDLSSILVGDEAFAIEGASLSPAVMPYKQMATKLYVAGTLFVYFIIILSAILITDISFVFQFIMPFSIVNIGFIIPAVFYLKAQHLYGNPENKNVLLKCFSWIFIAFGILVFLFQETMAVIINSQ